MSPTRPGATLATDLNTLRRLMPLILPRRMDALLFFEVPVPVDTTLAWLDEVNATREQPITLFQLVQAAMLRTLVDRPRLNRFVKGGRVWQRDHVALTFAVKRSFHDDARIVSTKIRLDDDDGVHDVSRRIAEAVTGSRSGKSKGPSAAIRGLPQPVIRAALAIRRALDDRGWISAAAVDADPLHTSAMISNVGSLGLDGVLHHLFEDGSCSINLSVGRVKWAPTCDAHGNVGAQRMLDLRFALDDRICDGFYYAASLRLFTWFLTHPEVLVGRRAGPTEVPPMEPSALTLRAAK